MLRGIKASLLLASVAVVGLALWAGAQVEPTGSRMAVTADRFVDSLTQTQAAKATYPYDSPERLNWHFIPRGRKGLPIKELSPEQRALAFALIQSGLSGSGFLKATTIMSLEQILRELEKGSGPVRDPELYYLTIFGKPEDRGKWGWRIEGHHLSLNFTLEDGKIIAATPAFFGSNPGEVRQGPRQGLQTLADRDERALRLVQALDDRPAQEGRLRREGPGGNPRGRHASAADRPGGRHCLRRDERRPAGHASGAHRVVRHGHADRGREGLARRDRQRRQRKRQVHLGRPGRPQPGACLSHPGTDLPDRIQ